MIALAILLLIAAAAIVVWVVMGLNGNNANTIHFDAPGINTDIKPLTLFLLGALALLLVWAATRLFAAGTKRKYRKHKENRELKREHKEQEKIYKREHKEHERAEHAHGHKGNDHDVTPEATAAPATNRHDDVVDHGSAHRDIADADRDRTAAPLEDTRTSDLPAEDIKETGRHYR